MSNQLITDTTEEFPLPEFSISLRVRYQETDAQGRLHHANYINYFEVGRVEMLRAAGVNYRDLEASGVMLVVAEVHCQYFQAAQYDDLLTIKTRVIWGRGARIKHHYQILREAELLAEGHTIVAAINPEGKVLRLPRWLRFEPRESQ
ncbi:MAG TPA: thioesterase family protein [Pirellulaceae bacterium]|nr:thioesterase family protein [Pirellulaceae bacterium]